MKIHMLYAGRGDAFLIEDNDANGNGVWYFLDGGPINTQPMNSYTVYNAPYWRYLASAMDGILPTMKPCAMVVSHLHQDHFGGILHTLQNLVSPTYTTATDKGPMVFNGPLVTCRTTLRSPFITTINGMAFNTPATPVPAFPPSPVAPEKIPGIPNMFFSQNSVYSRSAPAHPGTRMLRKDTSVDSDPENLASLLMYHSTAKAMFTGDSVGYKILDFMKQQNPDTRAPLIQGPLNVFKVPHHGSMRNSQLANQSAAISSDIAKLYGLLLVVNYYYSTQSSPPSPLLDLKFLGISLTTAFNTSFLDTISGLLMSFIDASVLINLFGQLKTMHGNLLSAATNPNKTTLTLNDTGLTADVIQTCINLWGEFSASMKKCVTRQKTMTRSNRILEEVDPDVTLFLDANNLKSTYADQMVFAQLCAFYQYFDADIYLISANGTHQHPAALTVAAIAKAASVRKNQDSSFTAHLCVTDANSIDLLCIGEWFPQWHNALEIHYLRTYSEVVIDTSITAELQPFAGTGQLSSQTVDIQALNNAMNKSSPLPLARHFSGTYQLKAGANNYITLDSTLTPTTSPTAGSQRFFVTICYTDNLFNRFILISTDHTVNFTCLISKVDGGVTIQIPPGDASNHSGKYLTSTGWSNTIPTTDVLSLTSTALSAHNLNVRATPVHQSVNGNAYIAALPSDVQHALGATPVLQDLLTFMIGSRDATFSAFLNAPSDFISSAANLLNLTVNLASSTVDYVQTFTGDIAVKQAALSLQLPNNTLNFSNVSGMSMGFTSLVLNATDLGLDSMSLTFNGSLTISNTTLTASFSLTDENRQWTFTLSNGQDLSSLTSLFKNVDVSQPITHPMIKATTNNTSALGFTLTQPIQGDTSYQLDSIFFALGQEGLQALSNYLPSQISSTFQSAQVRVVNPFQTNYQKVQIAVNFTFPLANNTSTLQATFAAETLLSDASHVIYLVSLQAPNCSVLDLMPSVTSPDDATNKTRALNTLLSPLSNTLDNLSLDNVSFVVENQSCKDFSLQVSLKEQWTIIPGVIAVEAASLALNYSTQWSLDFNSDLSIAGHLVSAQFSVPDVPSEQRIFRCALTSRDPGFSVNGCMSAFFGASAPNFSTLPIIGNLLSTQLVSAEMEYAYTSTGLALNYAGLQFYLATLDLAQTLGLGTNVFVLSGITFDLSIDKPSTPDYVFKAGFQGYLGTSGNRSYTLGVNYTYSQADSSSTLVATMSNYQSQSIATALSDLGLAVPLAKFGEIKLEKAYIQFHRATQGNYTLKGCGINVDTSQALTFPPDSPSTPGSIRVSVKKLAFVYDSTNASYTVTGAATLARVDLVTTLVYMAAGYYMEVSLSGINNLSITKLFADVLGCSGSFWDDTNWTPFSLKSAQLFYVSIQNPTQNPTLNCPADNGTTVALTPGFGVAAKVNLLGQDLNIEGDVKDSQFTLNCSLPQGESINLLLVSLQNPKITIAAVQNAAKTNTSYSFIFSTNLTFLDATFATTGSYHNKVYEFDVTYNGSVGPISNPQFVMTYDDNTQAFTIKLPSFINELKQTVENALDYTALLKDLVEMNFQDCGHLSNIDMEDAFGTDATVTLVSGVDADGHASKTAITVCVAVTPTYNSQPLFTVNCYLSLDLSHYASTKMTDLLSFIKGIITAGLQAKVKMNIASSGNFYAWFSLLTDSILTNLLDSAAIDTLMCIAKRTPAAITIGTLAAIGKRIADLTNSTNDDHNSNNDDTNRDKSKDNSGKKEANSSGGLQVGISADEIAQWKTQIRQVTQLAIDTLSTATELQQAVEAAYVCMRVSKKSQSIINNSSKLSSSGGLQWTGISDADLNEITGLLTALDTARQNIDAKFTQVFLIQSTIDSVSNTVSIGLTPSPAAGVVLAKPATSGSLIPAHPDLYYSFLYSAEASINADFSSPISSETSSSTLPQTITSSTFAGRLAIYVQFSITHQIGSSANSADYNKSTTTNQDVIHPIIQLQAPQTVTQVYDDTAGTLTVTVSPVNNAVGYQVQILDIANQNTVILTSTNFVNYQCVLTLNRSTLPSNIQLLAQVKATGNSQIRESTYTTAINKQAITIVQAPQISAVTITDNQQVMVQWTAVSKATGYRFVLFDANGTPLPAAQQPAVQTGNTYQLSAPTATAPKVFFKLSAIAANAICLWSDISTANAQPIDIISISGNVPVASKPLVDVTGNVIYFKDAINLVYHANADGSDVMNTTVSTPFPPCAYNGELYLAFKSIPRLPSDYFLSDMPIDSLDVRGAIGQGYGIACGPVVALRGTAACIYWHDGIGIRSISIGAPTNNPASHDAYGFCTNWAFAQDAVQRFAYNVSPVVHNDYIYQLLGDNQLWRFTVLADYEHQTGLCLSTSAHSAPAVMTSNGSDYVYFQGENNQLMQWFTDRQSLQALDIKIWGDPVSGNDGFIYFVDFATRRIARTNCNGVNTFIFEQQGDNLAESPPAVIGDYIYFTNGIMQMIRMRKTGMETYALNMQSSFRPMLFDGIVYCQDNNNVISRINKDKSIKNMTVATPYPPCAYNGVLYLAFKSIPKYPSQYFLSGMSIDDTVVRGACGQGYSIACGPVVAIRGGAACLYWHDGNGIIALAIGAATNNPAPHDAYGFCTLYALPSEAARFSLNVSPVVYNDAIYQLRSDNQLWKFSVLADSTHQSPICLSTSANSAPAVVTSNGVDIVYFQGNNNQLMSVNANGDATSVKTYPVVIQSAPVAYQNNLYFQGDNSRLVFFDVASSKAYWKGGYATSFPPSVDPVSQQLCFADRNHNTYLIPVSLENIPLPTTSNAGLRNVAPLLQRMGLHANASRTETEQVGNYANIQP